MFNSQTTFISILKFLDIYFLTELCRLFIQVLIWLFASGPRGSRTTASEGEDWFRQPGNISSQTQDKSNTPRQLRWRRWGQWGGETVSATAGLQDGVHPPGGTLQVQSGHHAVGWEVGRHVTFYLGSNEEFCKAFGLTQTIKFYRVETLWWFLGCKRRLPTVKPQNIWKNRWSSRDCMQTVTRSDFIKNFSNVTFNRNILLTWENARTSSHVCVHASTSRENLFFRWCYAFLLFHFNPNII